jgi:hypothetical protein
MDRAFQLQLLRKLRDIYPAERSFIEAPDGEHIRPLVHAVHYLQEHGLLSASWTTFDTPRGGFQRPYCVRITAKGLDFLADDGGLTATLGVVTVRLHQDTLKALLLQKVAESDEPEDVRQRVVEKIKSLPADALGKVTERAIEAGLSKMPGVANWLWQTIASMT